MRWWRNRSYAVKVYVRAGLIIIVLAGGILAAWAHQEIASSKRNGYRECVRANFTFQPNDPSKLDADAKLALCEEDAPDMVDVITRETGGR